ncbi:MAG: exosortase [Bryobacteraceae bacterium]
MATQTVSEPSLGPARAKRYNCWKPLVIAGFVALLYFRVIRDLILDWWTNPGYSHGILILPLAGYLIWRDRDHLLRLPVVSENRAVIVTLAACLIYLAGRLAAEFFLARISLIILVVGLTWTFWGTQRLRVLAFPILLLASVIPLPTILYNQLAAPLQLLASRLATDLAQAMGITVYRDGNIINLGTTSLGVAEACSGLRSLASLTVAALLVGHVESLRNRTRVLLFFSAIPIAIAFNVLRVTGTAILAEKDADLASGFYHSVSGWLIFLGGFGALMLTGKVLRALLEGKKGRA